MDEGFIIGASLFDLEPVVMPADTDNVALRFQFQVHPETTAASTEVRFLDGGRYGRTGHEVINVVTVKGTGVDLELADSFVFVNGFISVIDDIATFIRGDSNGDQVMDVSDAITTLNFLFLGNARPRCFDAADFDDNGRLDMADPVGTLTHLFLGGTPPAPPFREAGEDPTPDGMSCTAG